MNARFEKLSSDAQDSIDVAQEKVDILKQALACDENQLTELLATAQKSVEEAQEAYDKAEQSGSSAKYLARSQLLKAQQLEKVAGKLLEDKKTGSTAAFDEYNGQLAAAEDEIAGAKKSLKPLKRLHSISMTDLRLALIIVHFMGTLRRSTLSQRCFLCSLFLWRRLCA